MIEILIIIILIIACVVLGIFSFFKIIFMSKEARRIRNFLINNKEKIIDANKIIKMYNENPEIIQTIDRENKNEKYALMCIAEFVKYYNEQNEILKETYNYNFAVCK